MTTLTVSRWACVKHMGFGEGSVCPPCVKEIVSDLERQLVEWKLCAEVEQAHGIAVEAERDGVRAKLEAVREWATEQAEDAGLAELRNKPHETDWDSFWAILEGA